ncbi:hypothetical protein FD755_002720 [Muntiacus reevesi]|uniref:Delta-sarcoglycan n=1 Tax=Muntiacus reevesi TaxID=9886 RepID=A0A5J5N702_MUNRE|nr:hypothetical protein FD755_002720 [Muntiacus reevesi]
MSKPFTLVSLACTIRTKGEGVGWGIFVIHKGVTSQGKGGLREKLKPVLSRGVETSGTQTWEMEKNPLLLPCPGYYKSAAMNIGVHVSLSDQVSSKGGKKDFPRSYRGSPMAWSRIYFRLESPTRSLVMEAPKGVEINAEAGNMEATCRTELRLESKDGEIKLDAAKIKLPRLPHGSYTPAGARQKVFEICVCANGRLFLSQAGAGSTCQINTSVCL